MDKPRDVVPVIEKGVPIPRRIGSWGQFFLTLDQCDSFHWPCNDGQRCAIISNAKRYGVDLTSRREADGYRFWRINDRSNNVNGKSYQHVNAAAGVPV